MARTKAVEETTTALQVERFLSPANAPHGVRTQLTWSPAEQLPQSLTGIDDAALTWLQCHIEVEPVGDWPGTWPRVGLHLELPLIEDLRARWFGLGPGESWADQRAAVWLGRHELPALDLVTAHVRPQASGHRSEVRELALLEGDTPALVVRALSQPIGFTLSRWSPVESQVGHQHELPTPRAWHLHLDLAQHGVGSRSCGSAASMPVIKASSNSVLDCIVFTASISCHPLMNSAWTTNWRPPKG